MANIFAFILIILILITGVIWCIDRFKRTQARNIRQVQICTDSTLDKSVLIKVKKSSWLEIIGSVFPVLLTVFILRSFIYEPFQIPSGSMMPTLLIGDFILVEKFAYGVKNPITQTTLIPIGHPKRGDIAVFKYPKNPHLDYIKRVIGLSGDYVIYNMLDKTLTIYPMCSNGKICEKELPITYTDVKPSNFIQTFDAFDNGLGSSFWKTLQNKNMSRSLHLATRKETIGNVTHDILFFPNVQNHIYHQQSKQLQVSWSVPDGHYFMMGDNRDNSADSRYWGFVPEKNLVGKAVAIWMSFEKEEGKWPTGIRLNRINTIH